MLFKLSLKNIGKSMKDYAIYFFTLIVGVAVFYIFNAIGSQTVMLTVSQNTLEIIELMVEMLSGVSVFVSIILGFLIIYASRFLMKRRNKEFGIYLTLGMGKRKISLILFFEALIIGLISLAAGLLVGAGLSQVMSVFVANMFEADMTSFTFIFSVSACKKTILYFGIMYMVVMVFNTISISRCRLIDLLQAGKKTEQVKLKNPWLCTVVFMISACVLGRAYYMVTAGFSELQFANELLKPITMGIISAFLIFWSLSGLLLRVFMSMKKTYYKGLNSFILRQISSKINTTVCGMSVICLMLFLTICGLASSYSIKNSLTMELDELAPVDVGMKKFVIPYEPEESEEYDETAAKTSAMTIEELYTEAGTDLDSLFTDAVGVFIYRTEELTMETALGEYMEELYAEYPYLAYDTEEDIISVSDYNRVAALYGKETYSLAEDEYMVIADYQSFMDIRSRALAEGTIISVFGHSLTPKYDTCKEGFLRMAGTHENIGIFVVPDAVLENMKPSWEYLAANYSADTKDGKKEIEGQITANTGITDKVEIDTKIDICESCIGLGAMVTFIGLYLGIILLISSAAILALKELSESTDNIERYHMLRKLGGR